MAAIQPVVFEKKNIEDTRKNFRNSYSNEILRVKIAKRDTLPSQQIPNNAHFLLNRYARSLNHNCLRKTIKDRSYI